MVFGMNNYELERNGNECIHMENGVINIVSIDFLLFVRGKFFSQVLYVAIMNTCNWSFIMAGDTLAAFTCTCF